MKFKKWLFAGLACTMALAFAVGCTPGTQSGGPNDDPEGPNDDPGKKPTAKVTLQIQATAPLRSDYRAQLAGGSEPGSQGYNQALFTKYVVDGFAAIHPEIQLNFQPDGWADELLERQMLQIADYTQRGVMARDIFIGESQMGYFAQNGLFHELDASKFTDVLPESYASMVVDGKMYGVPMCTNVFGLQYNTQILQEVGIPEDKWEPKTWTELLDNCRTVSEFAQANGKNYGGFAMNNVPGMSSAFRALAFVRQAGGDFVDADGNPTFNSEECIEAYEYLRSLAQYSFQGSINLNEDPLQIAFQKDGRAAYMIEHASPMATAGDHIKSCALPTNDDGTAGNVFVGNVLFGITEGSKYKAEAELFLEYLTSKEVQAWFYELDGRLPVSMSYLQSEEIKTVQPNVNAYIDMLNAGGIGDSIPFFPVNASNIWGIDWTDMYRAVLEDNGMVRDLANAAQASIVKRLKG